MAAARGMMIRTFAPPFAGSVTGLGWRTAWLAAAIALIAGAAFPHSLAAQERRYQFAQGLIFVYAEADRDLAEALWPVMIADQKEIMERLGLHPSATLRVVLAPTWSDFLAAQPEPAPPNALGLYFPATRTVLLRSPRTDPGGEWDLRGVMRHELAHGLLDLAIEQPLPRWLNEGLAILLADELSFLDDSRLTLAAARDRLMPLDLLMTTFPAGEEGMTFAYAQAASFARFLLRLSGMEGIRSLLGALATGVPLSQAFARAYGRSLDELERAWHEELAGRFSWLAFLTSTTVLGTVGAPLLVAGALRRWVQRRRRYQEWEAEERLLASGLQAPAPARRHPPRWLN